MNSPNKNERFGRDEDTIMTVKNREQCSFHTYISPFKQTELEGQNELEHLTSICGVLTVDNFG